MDIIRLDSQIKSLLNGDELQEYIYVTRPLIDKYLHYQSKPKSSNFFNKKKDNHLNSNEINPIFSEYISYAKHYTNIDYNNINIINIETNTKNKNKNNNNDIFICECGNTEFISPDEHILSCVFCGLDRENNRVSTSFKDIERINVSVKYKYSKHTYFRETINRYEGKQNKTISPEVFEAIISWSDKHHIQTKQLSKEQVFMALQETKNSIFYEDVNLIHSHFTGIPCNDISHVKHHLFGDFDKVIKVYETLNLDRVNSLNSQYILFQLLRRKGIVVSRNDIFLLKTREKMVEYDNIYKQICEILEWTFIPVA